MAEIILSGLLHLAQNFCADCGWRELFATHFNPGVAVLIFDDGVRHQADVFLHFFFFKATTDQALDRVDRGFRVGHSLPFGGRADGDLAVFHVGNCRGRGARAFRVFDHFGDAAFNHGHAAIGGAEIDSDNFAHDVFPFISLSAWATSYPPYDDRYVWGLSGWFNG